MKNLQFHTNPSRGNSLLCAAFVAAVLTLAAFPAAAQTPTGPTAPSTNNSSITPITVTLPYGICEADIAFGLSMFSTESDYQYGTDYTVTPPENNAFKAGSHHVTWTVKHVAGSTKASFEEFTVQQAVTVGYSPCGEGPTGLTVDYDNYGYPTVRMGCDCWLRENLRNTHDADNNEIPNTAYYNNDAANLTEYGRLYTYDAATSGAPQGICPDGWRLPSRTDFEQMVESAGGVLHVKDNGAGHWLGNGGGADNVFDALPGGWREADGACTGLLGEGRFWLYPAGSDGQPTGACVTYYCSDVLYSTAPARSAYSVRCVKTAGAAVPTVFTGTPTHITMNSTVGCGTVVYDGGATVTARGICWSTAENPTVADSHTTDGSGTGSFTSSITGLEPSTTYYVRAYATNSAGTAYGNQTDFTTCSNMTFTIVGEGYNPDVRFVMKPVPGGTFFMGAQKTDVNGQNYDADAYSIETPEHNESPVHKVTLTQDYWMGETEVTQALWQAVMRQRPTSDVDKQWIGKYGIGDNYPAYYISWNDIQSFLTALNDTTASQRGNKTFAMPTEAQWEFAARGGNQSRGYKYAGSDSAKEVAWYKDISDNMSHPVKGKSPNELGLYDMSGNVWEWCNDWFGIYGGGEQTNPTGPGSGTTRVLCGGGWWRIARYSRVSCRSSNHKNYRSDILGFRLVLLP